MPEATVEENRFSLSEKLNGMKNTFHISESGNYNPIWIETYDNAWVTSIDVYNGYIYVAGSVNSIPQKQNDILLLKYDTNGNFIWSKTWNKYPYDAAWGIDVYGGYIYVCGYGSDWRSAITYSNILLLKYDTNGNLIWSRDYDDADFDFAYSLLVENNSIYVGGQSNCESLVLKYDLNGYLKWKRTYSESEEMYSEIIQLSSHNGYIYAVGQTEDSKGDDDILILKYDSDSNVVWMRKWETIGSQKAYGIDTTDENVYISGFGDIADVDATGLLLKYNCNGDFLWQTSYEHVKFENIREKNGNIYVTGETTGTSADPLDWDIVIAKFDSEGNLLNEDVVYNSGCDIPRDIDIADDSLYVSGSQGDDALIMKFRLDIFNKKIYSQEKSPIIYSKIQLNDDVRQYLRLNHVYPTYKTAICTEDYLEVITGAADWLICLAEPSGNGYKWPISENEKEYYTNLMEGVPGVSLFLLRVYEVTGEEIYLTYAEEGMNWLISMAVSEGGGYKWPEKETSSYYPTGYYYGAAGIGKVFLDFYQSLKNPIYLQYAEGAASWIRSVNGIKYGCEIIGGAAGIGDFFLKLYDATGDSQYLNYAKVGGDWLISTAEECPVVFLTDVGNPLHRTSPIENGYLWVFVPLYWITSTGFGHGTSGPVYFLAELYNKCNEQKYLECAEKAAKWIIHEAVIEGDGDMQWRWKYMLDQGYSIFSYNTGWCYGNAGIGKAFMSLYEATSNPYYLEILEESTDWLIENAIPDEGGYKWIFRGPRVETSWTLSAIAQMCHGVAGIADYFLDLYTITGNYSYISYGIGATEWLKNVAIEIPEGYKWDWASDYTGYVFGSSGIGLSLLNAYGMNFPPDKPLKPSGPLSGKTGAKYSYKTSTVDPNGDKIKYGWDWDGDEAVDEWTDLYDSGETIETSHSWDKKGIYDIRVKAQDERGLESEWSDPLPVTIPRGRAVYHSILLRLFEQFPNTFPILRQLLGSQ